MPAPSQVIDARDQDGLDDAPTTLDLPHADEIFDAGALGCGDGPLTQIAARLRAMPPGAVLEVRSTDPGVAADLPAWCRMVGHTYLGGGTSDYAGRYFVRRKDA
jgi:tRNA 2-thiouridine synthesizing protein A